MINHVMSFSPGKSPLLISCLLASHLWLYNYTSIVTHSAGISSSSPLPAGTSSSLPDPPTGTSSSLPDPPTGTSSSLPDPPTGTSSSLPDPPTGTSSSLPDPPTGTSSSSPPPAGRPSDPQAQLTTSNNYAEVQLKSQPNTTTQQYAVIAPQSAVASSLPQPGCPSTPPLETPGNSAPPTVDENYAVVQNKIGHPNTTTGVIAPLPAVAPSLPPPRSPSTPSSHFPSYPAPPTVDENYAEVQNKTGHPNTTQLYAVIAPLPAVAPSLPPSRCPSTLSSQFPSYPAPPTVDENYAEVQNKTGHPNTTQLYAVIAPLPAAAPSLPPPAGHPSTPPSHSPSDPAPSTVDAIVKQNTVNPPNQVSAKT